MLEFESSERYSPRQKAALLYTSMLVWNPAGADEAVWERLREHFSDEEIVELGYFVSVAYGGQCVLRTLDVRHGEYMATTSGGLAPGTIGSEAG